MVPILRCLLLCVFVSEMHVLQCEDIPSTSIDPSYCSICDSDGWDGFALQCRHFFCRECWTSHAAHMLLSGIVPVTCPVGITELLHFLFFIMFSYNYEDFLLIHMFY